MKELAIRNLDIPFIIVSGTISEDVAVEMMKSGVHDYLTKNNLTRLVPAIEREIEEADQRRKRRDAEKHFVQLTTLPFYIKTSLVMISDNGPGINDDYKKNLLDPECRAGGVRIL